MLPEALEVTWILLVSVSLFYILRTLIPSSTALTHDSCPAVTTFPRSAFTPRRFDHDLVIPSTPPSLSEPLAKGTRPIGHSIPPLTTEHQAGTALASTRPQTPVSNTTTLARK